MCDGHVIYQGEAKDSTRYFEDIDIPCPKFSNPADFFMKILTIDYPKNSNDEKKLEYLCS